jgi:hypothetical protein
MSYHCFEVFFLRMKPKADVSPTVGVTAWQLGTTDNLKELCIATPE